jgi:hypothetical protein
MEVRWTGRAEGELAGLVRLDPSLADRIARAVAVFAADGSAT